MHANPSLVHDQRSGQLDLSGSNATTLHNVAGPVGPAWHSGMHHPHYLAPFVQPRAIVVFTGGRTGLDDTRRLLHNLVGGGYQGRVAVIDADHDELCGLPCHTRLSRLPFTAELAIFTDSAEHASAHFAEWARHGIRAVLLVGGMARPGPSALRELARAARLHSLRVLGPNSLGLLRPALGYAASTAPAIARSGPLALITQSSALCAATLDWAGPNRIGFSFVTSLGAGVDVDFGDLLDFCLHDPRTEAIIVHIERIRNARRFMSALRSAARVKPVLLIKTGRHTPPENDGVVSHAPGGHDTVFNAALRRCGVIRLDNVGQLFSAANALVAHLRPHGRRLAILTNGGGLGRMAVDKAIDLDIIPVPGADGTPLLDLGARADAPAFHEAISRALAAEDVDGVLVLFAPRGGSDPLEVARAVSECARRSSKPLIACWMGDEHVRDSRAHFIAHGIPNVRTPEPAIELFDHLANFYRNQKLLMQVPGPFSRQTLPDPAIAQAHLDAALALGRQTLEPDATRACLAAFHIALAAPPSAPEHGPGAHTRTLAIGVHLDGVFGPVISLGKRRVRAWTRAVALPPLNPYLAHDLVDATARLPDFEATPFTADERDALVALLLRVSEMVCELPNLAGLELAPLQFVGDRAQVSDAELLLRPDPTQATPYGHMAIHPYPTRLAHELVLADDTRLTIRPIRPEDARLASEFVHHLSNESKFLRFMNTVRELSPTMVARLTQIDYDREMAFIAVRHDGGREIQVGVSRYAIKPDGETCEFAIVIADAWRRRGIAHHLMQLLIETARTRGLKRMEGVFLANNEHMLRFAARFGFIISPDPDDAHVRIGVLTLQE